MVDEATDDVPATRAIVFKINIDGVPNDEIPNYMEAVQSKLMDEKLKAQGFIFYFLPVRNVPTTMSFINLTTMAAAHV